MTQATDLITLRIPRAQKAVIDMAAQILGKTRTAFILEDTVRRAEDIVAEETRFRLSAEQWQAFHDALDAPVPSNPALHKLLHTPAPWDEA